MFYVCNYCDDIICYVNTEEEAKRICDYANAHGEDYYYYKLSVSTADEEIARIKQDKAEEREEKINTLTKRIKETTEGIEALKKCKEFLDRYLIGVEDFIPLIPEMYEAVMKTDLPISFYDGKRDYDRDDGITEARGERLSYAPIYVDISVDGNWFYYYKNGNYNIEDDIKRLENTVSRLETELAELKSEVN